MNLKNILILSLTLLLYITTYAQQTPTQQIDSLNQIIQKNNHEIERLHDRLDIYIATNASFVRLFGAIIGIFSFILTVSAGLFIYKTNSLRENAEEDLKKIEKIRNDLESEKIKVLKSELQSELKEEQHKLFEYIKLALSTSLTENDHLSQGQEERIKGNYRKAKAHFIIAIKNNPNDIQAYANLANVCDKLNQKDEALKYIDLAIQKNEVLDILEHDILLYRKQKIKPSNLST